MNEATQCRQMSLIIDLVLLPSLDTCYFYHMFNGIEVSVDSSSMRDRRPSTASEVPSIQQSTAPRIRQSITAESQIQVDDIDGEFDADTTFAQTTTDTPILASQTNTTLKTFSRTHQTQIKALQMRSEEDVRIMEFMRDYLKRYVDLEQSYCKEVEKLNRAFKQKLNMASLVSSPSPVSGAIPSGSTPNLKGIVKFHVGVCMMKNVDDKRRHRYSSVSLRPEKSMLMEGVYILFISIEQLSY